MATPQEITDTLQRGKQYYSDQLHDNILQLKKGCVSCCKSSEALWQIIYELDYKVSLSEFDDVTDKLYRCLSLIIGNYQPAVAPIVNAGANASITLPTNTRNFTGTVTQGSSPIVSTVWTQVSGPNTATLTNANTLTLTASNLIQGTYVFRLTVTDQNNLIGSDDVQLTVNAAQLLAYYGTTDSQTPLTYSQIIAGSSNNFSPNGDVTIPYNNTPVDFLWFAVPATQADLNYYNDLGNPLNQGNMGSPDDLFGTPVLVTGATNYKFYITNYPTQYPNYSPIRGFKFTRI